MAQSFVWDPQQYLKFKKERMQPALDLLNRVDFNSPGRIIDMGCGPGNNTVFIEKKWPGASVTGLDSSREMLEKAKELESDVDWVEYDMHEDLNHLGKFDIVFSNAVIQWLKAQDEAVKKLFLMLNPGGVLAVQIPYPVNIPYKIEMRRLSESHKWRHYFKFEEIRPKFRPYTYYYDVLKNLTGEFYLWQTDYIQPMTYRDIIEWDRSTGLKPFTNALPSDELREEFINEYTEAVKQVYAIEGEQKTLVPFTRIFFLAHSTK